MLDLRNYSDRELELIVYNDEYLYNMRHTTELLEALNGMYIYNAAQLRELETALEEEQAEL